MKHLIVIGLICVVLGLVSVGASAYFVVDRYFLGNGGQSDKDEFMNKLDTDKDGITDKKEVDEYGTDPNKKDTDGDGYGDKEEIDAGYDPLVSVSK
ncbi:MAG: hypothetical protein ACD_63C00081G0001 [uncultured bacterium]|nr:MAG: hypothetical protein ACD_63C00081G0001 [uncultured bacterium]